MSEKGKQARGFWVVSPNVRNNEGTVPAWKGATLKFGAAFMGYRPDDHGIGYKFARTIKPGDIVLVARRHDKKPDLVGFGVVKGKFRKRLKGFTAPEEGWRGSLRLLSPFNTVSRFPDAVSGTSMMKALAHQAALRSLNPVKRPEHKSVCSWMERSLDGPWRTTHDQSSEPMAGEARFVGHSRKGELEYEVRSRARATRAVKREEKLVRQYLEWLSARNRITEKMRREQLCCDVYERDRNNLIEAKASAKREYIRMAVGQLLDYSYLGRDIFSKPHMAILLPEQPNRRSIEWLPNEIAVIWRKGRVFEDNANGAFT